MIYVISKDTKSYQKYDFHAHFSFKRPKKPLQKGNFCVFRPIFDWKVQQNEGIGALKSIKISES